MEKEEAAATDKGNSREGLEEAAAGIVFAGLNGRDNPGTADRPGLNGPANTDEIVHTALFGRLPGRVPHTDLRDACR